MSVTPEHRWPTPPVGGYTSDDLDRLPDLPPHTELIDGSLVFVSPQTNFHLWAIRLLEYGLLAAVPTYLAVMREMNLVLGPRQRPEPDLMVVRTDAIAGSDQTYYQADDALLVIEVISPESEARDRETKPQKYADAGIRHFWRVERGEDRLPVVYVYELDAATRKYALTGIYHDQLKLTVPFTIDIDLTTMRR